MGELEPWIDENFVRSIWYNMGETVNVFVLTGPVPTEALIYIFRYVSTHVNLNVCQLS